MRALRWTAASLLGLLGGLLGLVGALLCVTLILLPLGIPILFLSRRLFQTAGQLVVPREVRHPVKGIQERSSASAKSARKSAKTKRRKGAKRAAETMGSATAGVRGGAKNAKNVLVDAASTAREKTPVPGRRSRMDRVRHKLHLA
jgi:predicted lipid-binding transport protein (Tim44 family)